MENHPVIIMLTIALKAHRSSKQEMHHRCMIAKSYLGIVRKITILSDSWDEVGIHGPGMNSVRLRHIFAGCEIGGKENGKIQSS
jgi:hypothetical protein